MTSIVNSAIKPVTEDVTDMKNALEVRNKKAVGRNPGTLGIQKSRDFTPFPGIRLG